MEARKYAEIAVTGALSLGLVAVAFCAYSQLQRAWIRERDEGKCQFPVSSSPKGYTPCGRTEHLEVHHVSPQRWSRERLHWSDEQIDSAENGLTLCEQHHQRVIHGPDMPLARANFHKDKGSFKKAFANREALIAQGLIYWNNCWDEVMKMIAHVRTLRFTAGGAHPFPKHNERATAHHN